VILNMVVHVTRQPSDAPEFLIAGLAVHVVALKVDASF
jgi:hypothetical protein